MKTKIISAAIVAASLLGLGGCANMDRTTVGTVGGAVVGGRVVGAAVVGRLVVVGRVVGAAVVDVVEVVVVVSSVDESLSRNTAKATIAMSTTRSAITAHAQPGTPPFFSGSAYGCCP